MVTTCELDPNCVGKGGENQSKPGEIFRFVEKLNMCGCMSGIKVKKISAQLLAWSFAFNFNIKECRKNFESSVVQFWRERQVKHIIRKLC